MSVYQRGRFWHFDFEEAGRRYFGTTRQTNKREALRFVERYRTEIRDAGKAGKVTVKTLAEVVALYEAARLPVVRSKTMIHPHKRLIEHLGGDNPFHEITTADLNRMISQRLRDGTPANTLRLDAARFSTLRLWLEAEHPEIKTPAIGKVRLPKKTNKIRILNSDEEEATLFRDLAALANPRPLRVATILLDTGMRYGELATLTWSSLFLDDAKATIYRSKTDSLTTLPLTDRVIRILRALRREVPRDQPYVFPECVNMGDDRALVRAMNASAINADHIVQRYGKFTPHSFRHTYATRLIRKGISPAVVQRLMGHTILETTMRYVQLVQEDGMDEALAALNDLAVDRTASPDESPNVQRLYG